MSNKMDITLPLVKWGIKDPNYEQCIRYCEKRVKELQESDAEQYPLRINKYRIIPQADIYSFCLSMLRSAMYHDATFNSIITSSKKTTFSFFIKDSRKYDKFYYNLVYLMSSNGILSMQDSIKRRKKSTD